jgi:alkylhydroperoxidase family enzyme
MGFLVSPIRPPADAGYFDDLMRGSGSGLIKAHREMIAVVVSAENQCHY